MHSVSIQLADAVVKKIEIGYDRDNGVLCGFKLYAQNGAIVLRTDYHDWVEDGW